MHLRGDPLLGVTGLRLAVLSLPRLRLSVLNFPRLVVALLPVVLVMNVPGPGVTGLRLSVPNVPRLTVALFHKLGTCSIPYHYRA